MKRLNEVGDPRRRLLIKALAAGLFSAGLPSANALAAGVFGSKPARLPAGKSVYRISGQATVNGREATLQTRINPGDTVQTEQNSEIIFVVNGNHSMILRGRQPSCHRAPESCIGLVIDRQPEAADRKAVIRVA